MIKVNDCKMKHKTSPLRAVRSIHSIAAAIAFIAPSQRQAARLIGVDQGTLSKAARGKVRLKDHEIESLAREVARTFRVLTGHDDWGLKYTYNSPLQFSAWGVCRNHRKPVEYRLVRMTTRCPACRHP